MIMIDGENSYDDDDKNDKDDNDLVPSSASPPWKFGQVNWEIILYLRCGYYGNILAVMAKVWLI